MTPHELTLKTVKDIEKRRQQRKRQAQDYYFDNFRKINRRIGRNSYGADRNSCKV